MARQQILRDIHNSGLDPKKKHTLHKTKLGVQTLPAPIEHTSDTPTEPVIETPAIDLVSVSVNDETVEAVEATENDSISDEPIVEKSVKSPKPPKRTKK